MSAKPQNSRGLETELKVISSATKDICLLQVVIKFDGVDCGRATICSGTKGEVLDVYERRMTLGELGDKRAAKFRGESVHK